MTTTTASRPLPSMDATRIVHGADYPRQLRRLDSLAALQAAPELIAATAAAIQQVIDRHEIRLLSFDVFDTALLRQPDCEARRFFAISQAFASRHGGTRFSALDALLARQQAARSAYTYATPAADGTREGQHALIAALTCELLLVPELVADYQQAELAYERAHLQPHPLVQQVIAANPQRKVVFISDMYLTAPQIQALLQPHYGRRHVYSSADGQGSKRAGGLFEHVAQREQVALAQLLHLGDSLEGDYRTPKRHGAHACYLPLPDGERRLRQQSHAALLDELAASGLALQALIHFNP